MGTRNLTMVINQEGEKKVAQYGQWDGYPAGVGVGILNFLKDKDVFAKFKTNLSKVRFLDKEGVDKEFIESYNQLDNRTDEQEWWFYAYCSRDLSEKVLINIANSTDEEIILIDREDTAKSGGWVVYSYVINLKENTFGIYGYIDEEPIKVYKLDELPEQDVFVSELEGLEEN